MLFPFSALVGQDDMRLALILNAINPGIGGVLIRGEKGTAKSTAVRGLAAILPMIEAERDCRFPFKGDDLPNDLWPLPARTLVERPAPLVNLPLGITEDRLIGTLDFEAALQRGEKKFEPGLLAHAHQGILYIDEVNLLNDHLVDLLLDTAAMGTNIVEREGVSVTHPARFILIGTMNPEEGELRPQLLDRFGLAVDVAGSSDRTVRTEIVRRRLAFEADPSGFAQRYLEEESEIRARVTAARTNLPSVILPDELLDLIADICIQFDVDGMRADLIIHKTARTLAAWEGDVVVTPEQIGKAAQLALSHRQRRQPFEQSGLDQSQLDEMIDQHQQREREPESRSDNSEGD